MSLTNHCISLKSAKKLFELGVPQKSLFWWIYDNFKKEWIIVVKNIPQVNFNDGYIKLGSKTNAWYIEGFNDEYASNVDDYVSAFTSDEILEMLPPFITFEGEERWLTIKPIRVNKNGDKNWWVHYEGDGFLHLENKKSLPEALSLMLTYLLTNNLISL